MLILLSTNTDKIISNHYFWVRILGQRKQRIERLSHFWFWLRLKKWLCWYSVDCITLWWPGADLNNNRISYLVHRCTLRWNYQFFLMNNAKNVQTYSTNSLEQSRSWEVNSFSAGQHIPNILWNTKVYLLLIRAHQWSLSWARWIQSNLLILFP
jgi:hypothetical protein